MKHSFNRPNFARIQVHNDDLQRQVNQLLLEKQNLEVQLEKFIKLGESNENMQSVQKDDKPKRVSQKTS